MSCADDAANKVVAASLTQTELVFAVNIAMVIRL